MWAKQSTAATLIVGPILDSAGAEYASAVIGDISLSKNGATLTALASAATLTYIANGMYTLVLTTGNTDTLGRAQFTCNKSTYQMPPKDIMIVASAVYDTLVTNGTLASTTSGRTIVVDAAGLADANTVKIGPTGSGVVQTGRDIGASVLLSSGTGTGQLSFTSGILKVDVDTIKTNPVVNGGTVTFPTNSTLGTSTLTQAQVSGGGYALNSSSFAFNAGLDFTTTQKAATLAHVTLTDTATALTNAPPDSSGVTALLLRIPSGLFSGITSLAQWLGLIAGKQTGNSTARTEIRATGGGSGAFDETTDSQEALRDRGDAAWTTATSVTVSDKTGFSLANGSIVTATFGTCDFTSTMKTSIGTAVAASAVASVIGNVGGNVTGSVGSVAGGGITRASLAADTGLVSIRSNTAQAGASTTITLDASASSSNSFYLNCLILLTGGTGAGQSRFITAYNGTSKIATVAAWTTNPDNTTTFAILPFDSVPGATAPTAAAIADEVQTRTIAAVTTVGSVAGNVGGIAGTTNTFDALQTALSLAHGAGSWATATGFSTHSAGDVWNVATRVLTAGTNIALAKGVGVTGFNDVAATDIVSGGAINTSSGAVSNVTTTGSVTTKTGYQLASTGLDLIVPSEPSGEPSFGAATLPQWIGYFGAWTINPVDANSSAVKLRNNADSADIATHAIADDGTDFTSGRAT